MNHSNSRSGPAMPATLLSKQSAWVDAYEFAPRLAEQGTVVAVGDGIAWIAGLPSAAMDDLLVLDDGSRAIVFDLNQDLMSNRRELQQRLRRLGETREILNAMKNLALMEMYKLARCRDTEQQVVDLIERVAADFLGSYPVFPPTGPQTVNIYLLIGSERGFCGDFNEAILAALASQLQSPNTMPAQLIAVGHKLCSRLADNPRVIAALDGANAADEVPNVLNRLIEAINSPPAQSAALTVFYHSLDAGEVVKEALLSPFQRPLETASPFPYPPLLNLPPPVFLGELIDQYLFALLHQAFYTSLLAESHRRVAHTDGAVSHLDETVEALIRKSQILRQEEITEEIEVILLSAEGRNQP